MHIMLDFFRGGGEGAGDDDGAAEDDCATVKVSPLSTKEEVSQWLLSTFPEWGQNYAAEFMAQEVDGEALGPLVEADNSAVFAVRWTDVVYMHVLVSWLVT